MLYHRAMQPHAESLVRPLLTAQNDFHELQRNLHASILEGGLVGGLVAGLIIATTLILLELGCRPRKARP